MPRKKPPIVFEKEKIIEAVSDIGTPSIAAQNRKINAVGKVGAEKITCTIHGKTLVINPENFYMSNPGSIWKGLSHGKIPVCKECIRKMYQTYLFQNNQSIEQAVFLTCRRLDIKFDLQVCQGAITRANGIGLDVWGWYMQQTGSLKQNTEPNSFDDSDNIEKQGSIQDKYDEIQSSSKFDANDKRNKKDIIKKLGYNPFEMSGLPESQLKNLYAGLVSYIEDDDICSDHYKINTIINVLSTNNQIAQLDIYIGLLSTSLADWGDNLTQLSALTTQKTKLSASLTTTYKENKWLSEDTSAKARLAGLFKKYREYGFTEVETNYFSGLIAPAVKTVFDLSHQSIIENINFGDAEMNEVFRLQRELITNKDREIASLHDEKVDLARELVDYKTKNAVIDNG